MTALLPQTPKGSMIFTSRDKRVGHRLTNRGKVIVVEPFDPEEAEQLLQIGLAHQSDSVATDGRKLLEILEHITLAITQAIAFINENGMTLTDYIQRLNKSDSGLQAYMERDLPGHQRPEGENSVIRTWELSFDQLKETKTTRSRASVTYGDVRSASNPEGDPTARDRGGY
jgi:hypothetical protein